MLDTFKYHKNVQRIKLANFHSKRTLNFPKATEREVREEISNLSSKKGTKNGDIHTKILNKKGRHLYKRNSVYNK